MPSAHREAIDEIAEHLTICIAPREREGKTPADADAMVEAELARMGPLALAVAERAKRRRRAGPRVTDWKSGLAADLRHALRALRLDRSFSAIVVLTLAIGIGGCTAVFSIINSLLLGPLPYPRSRQLTMVWETDATIASGPFIVAQPVYEDWKHETRTLCVDGHLASTDLQRRVGRRSPNRCRASAPPPACLPSSAWPPAIGRVFTRGGRERRAIASS